LATWRTNVESEAILLARIFDAATRMSCDGELLRVARVSRDIASTFVLY